MASSEDAVLEEDVTTETADKTNDKTTEKNEKADDKEDKADKTTEKADTTTESNKKSDKTTETVADNSSKKNENSNTSNSNTTSTDNSNSQNTTVQPATTQNNNNNSSSNNSNNSNNSNVSNSNNGNSSNSNTTTEKQKVWHEPVYEDVWVVDDPGGDVEISEPHMVCNQCGYDLTQNGIPMSEHEIQTRNADGSSNCWSYSTKSVVVGTKHYDEIGHWEKKLVQEGYWE